MDKNILLNKKLNELEEKHRSEINKLVERSNALKELITLNLEKATLIKNKNYETIYDMGMNACVFSLWAIFSFMVGIGTFGMIFISIDIIIFIYTIVNSFKSIIEVLKNKKQRKEYEKKYNEILEEMTALKYQYYRERRIINQKYLNNQVENNIEYNYQVNNYITKEKEKKLIKSKKREL